MSDYRQKEIASSLTNQLALEVLSKNIVSFYYCAWSNMKSSRDKIKSGFVPVWVQMTVKTNPSLKILLMKKHITIRAVISQHKKMYKIGKTHILADII